LLQSFSLLPLFAADPHQKKPAGALGVHTVSVESFFKDRAKKDNEESDDEMRALEYYDYATLFESLGLVEALKPTISNVVVGTEKDVALLRIIKKWTLSLGCANFAEETTKLPEEIAKLVDVPFDSAPAMNAEFSYQLTLSKNIEESLSDVFETRYKGAPETFTPLDTKRFELRNEMLQSVDSEMKLLLNMATFLKSKGPRVSQLTQDLIKRIQEKTSLLAKEWKEESPFCASDVADIDEVERAVTEVHKDKKKNLTDPPTGAPVPAGTVGARHKNMIAKGVENAMARGKAEAKVAVAAKNKKDKTKKAVTQADIIKAARRAPGYCAKGVRLAHNPYFDPDFKVGHAYQANALFKERKQHYENIPLAGKKTTDFKPGTILVYQSCAPNLEKYRKKMGYKSSKAATKCSLPGAPSGWISYSGHITIRTDNPDFPFVSDFLESSRSVMTGEDPGVQTGLNSSSMRFYKLVGAYYPI